MLHEIKAGVIYLLLDGFSAARNTRCGSGKTRALRSNSSRCFSPRLPRSLLPSKPYAASRQHPAFTVSASFHQQCGGMAGGPFRSQLRCCLLKILNAAQRLNHKLSEGMLPEFLWGSWASLEFIRQFLWWRKGHAARQVYDLPCASSQPIMAFFLAFPSP